MKSNELRKAYLDHFEKNGHVVIPSSALVPENDASTLFTGSGMQPLLPYLLGTEHPEGKRLVDSQKCFRAEDINQVGDNRHTTFFEMLGNWSLGDYFKEEQLAWLFEFVTEVVGLEPERLYVTAFSGDAQSNIPKDEESGIIWKRLFAEKGIEAKEVEFGAEELGGQQGMQGGRIFYYDVKKNWWSRAGAPEFMPAGEPGGPDSEVFYEFADVEHDESFGRHCHPNCDCGRFLEIGNSVFMEYKKREDGSFEKLTQRNVDFGGGLERMVAASNNDPDVFKIDLLYPIIEAVESVAEVPYEGEHQKSYRIIADHIRGIAFMIADGVLPSNKEQGYVLRRLIRSLLVQAKKLNIPDEKVAEFLDISISGYKGFYKDLEEQREHIKQEFTKEQKNFAVTMERGLREFDRRYPVLSKEAGETSVKGHEVGKEAFDLYQSFGFPIEVIRDVLEERSYTFNEEEFRKKVEGEFAKHREVSRAGQQRKFGGHGLILDTGELKAATKEEVEIVVRLHTATHLLQSALRQILGDGIHQAGSDITAERTRFDFTFDRKLTLKEVGQVENLVNRAIQDDLEVKYEEMPYEKAITTGALHFTKEKYPSVVKVYTMDSKYPEPFSKELCGGPHVKRTSEVGNFKIIKDESVASGVRRIRGVIS